ncbi:hypothetical protein [Clostridium massiliamazoniense]|uniref:hypothetical protein n=1 Tax=Clostridium massiliamazoniense TaxID=1347366 RepID=UPI0006D79C96|nr:hypothetical protein [Clostridium massiliamazoniense]
MLRVYLLDRGMKNKKREEAILENNIQERIEFKRINKYRIQVERILRDLDNLDDEIINNEVIKVFKSAIKELESKSTVSKL